MDANLSSAARAAADMVADMDKLTSELAESKTANADFMAAIVQIAAVAATVQKTRTATASE